MARIQGFNERIGACAIIWASTHGEKADAIATERNVDTTTAARMYVTGALKASIRRGTARNYTEALAMFEDEQIGDRSVSVSSGSDALAREVRRINAANGRDYTSIVNGRAEYIDGKEGAPKRATTARRNMGRVLGELYTQWDNTIAAYRIDEAPMDIGNEAALYMREYIGRLSDTMRATIRHICEDRRDAAEIMKGETKATAKMRDAVKYMHRNFPQRESVTSTELCELVKKYA